MSDPVTNAEIEDVLSSIRRLVAGESAPERRPRSDAPPHEAESPDAPPDSALVLTPDQRLSDDEDDAARAWEADAQADAAAAAHAAPRPPDESGAATPPAEPPEMAGSTARNDSSAAAAADAPPAWDDPVQPPGAGADARDPAHPPATDMQGGDSPAAEEAAGLPPAAEVGPPDRDVSGEDDVPPPGAAPVAGEAPGPAHEAAAMAEPGPEGSDASTREGDAPRADGREAPTDAGTDEPEPEDPWGRSSLAHRLDRPRSTGLPPFAERLARSVPTQEPATDDSGGAPRRAGFSFDSAPRGSEPDEKRLTGFPLADPSAPRPAGSGPAPSGVAEATSADPAAEQEPGADDATTADTLTDVAATDPAPGATTSGSEDPAPDRPWRSGPRDDAATGRGDLSALEAALNMQALSRSGDRPSPAGPATPGGNPVASEGDRPEEDDPAAQDAAWEDSLPVDPEAQADPASAPDPLASAEVDIAAVLLAAASELRETAEAAPTPDERDDTASRAVPEPGRASARAEGANGSAPDTAPPAEDEAEEPNLFDEDDLLHSEALRTRIAEIVTEELQGPLGERLTRNIRRLVRREIEAALAARDRA